MTFRFSENVRIRRSSWSEVEDPLEANGSWMCEWTFLAGEAVKGWCCGFGAKMKEIKKYVFAYWVGSRDNINTGQHELRHRDHEEPFSGHGSGWISKQTCKNQPLCRHKGQTLYHISCTIIRYTGTYGCHCDFGSERTYGTLVWNINLGSGLEKKYPWRLNR